MIKYGKELFGYFCNHTNTTKIVIRNYNSLPQRLQNALFVEHQKLSIIPIISLFKCAGEIILCHLKIEQMNADCKLYVLAVLKYINRSNRINVKKIVFQSEPQNDSKINLALRNVVKKNVKKFRIIQWKIEHISRINKYNGLRTYIHALSFSINS